MAENGREHIEVRLREVNQLFNMMDPSPFQEKDLDTKAEEFIVSWARELDQEKPILLVVYLDNMPSEPAETVSEGIRNYFAYRADITRRRRREIVREGSVSLTIGLVFLTACLVGAEFIARRPSDTVLSIVRESLVIAGWVAMWRPMEIFLYERWPLRRLERLYTKLSEMKVEFYKRPAPASSHSIP